MAEYLIELNREPDPQTLKVKWFRGVNTRGHYSVREQLLRTSANDARQSLQELIEAGRGQDRSAKYPALLRDLAIAGHRLYRALFRGHENTQRTAEEIRVKLAERLNCVDDTMTFRVPPQLHIPWGLIYDHQVDQQTDPTEVAAEEFWCIKYGVVTQYFTMAAEGVEEAWSPTAFDLLFCAHRNVWNAAHAALGQSERQVLGDLLSARQQPLFELSDAVSLWKRNRHDRPHGLLNFYCHGAGDAVVKSYRSTTSI
jgi:hypothetical protein